MNTKKINIFILYINREGRNEALCLWQCLSKYGPICDSWWKLDHLRDDKIMKQALRTASQADIIIVTGTLKSRVWEWMSLLLNKLRLQRKIFRGALVSLLPNPTAQSLMLKKFAQNMGMDFFCPSSLKVAENPFYKSWSPLNDTSYFNGIEADMNRYGSVAFFHE